MSKRDTKTGEAIVEPTEEELELQRAATEAANAEMVQAPEGEIAIGDNTLTPAPAPDLVGDPGDWKKVMIVCGAPASIEAANGRKVIVVETRTQPDEKGEGAGQFDKGAKYPRGADAYLGYADRNDPSEIDRVFPHAQGKPVFMVGHNVRQFSLGGVSRHAGYLSVGPAHPVYAAVNLALQQTDDAQEVEIVGLTEYDKSILSPWLTKIAHEFKSLTY